MKKGTPNNLINRNIEMDEFYTYTVNAESNNPIMLLNKPIGFQEDGSEYIDGAIFQKELMYLTSIGKNVTIHVNSPGGSVMQGLSIYDAIITSPVPVNTLNGGIAASIAAVILLGGAKVFWLDHASAMVHNPYNPSSDDETESKDLATMRNMITTMLSKRSGLNTEVISSMMRETTWIELPEATKLGMCTDVIKTNRNDIKIEKDFQMKWKESNLVLNQLIKNKTKKMIEQLKEILNGYVPTSTDESKEIFSFVNEFLAKNKMEDEDSDKAEDKLKDVKMDEAENKASDEDDDKMEDAKNYEKMYNELKKNYDDMQNKIDSNVNSVKKEFYLKDAIKNGKITKTEETVWNEMFESNFTLAEKALNLLKVNSKSAVIDVPTEDNQDPIFNLKQHMNLSPIAEMNYRKNLEMSKLK